MSTKPASGNIQTLLANLVNADIRIRDQAQMSLVEAGSQAVLGLIGLLSSANGQIRWEAARALADIGEPSSAPALVKALDDENSGVRWLASKGLIRLLPASLTPLLEALVNPSSSVWLREGAHHILSGYRHTNTELAKVVTALEDIVEPKLEAAEAAGAALAMLDRQTRQHLAGKHKNNER